MSVRSDQCRPVRRGAFLVGLAILVLAASQARAGSLTDIFRGELAGLELEPIGDVLADTVASTYPVASASSSVAYAYNPKTETFERRTRVLGPIIGERAETVGSGEMDIAVTYSYVSPKRINGNNLGDLENRAVIDGRVVSFPVPDGVELADGRFTNFLPVHVKADLDVEAQIITPGVTYGLTPNLDVNLTIPLIRTYLRIQVTDEVPDPRLPQFALMGGDPNIRTRTRTFFADSFGIGDVLLRLKYVFLRGAPVDLAAGLGLSFPSGDPENLQGTGDTHLTPSLVVSRVFGDRFEPLLNLGFDLNADDVERSSFRWALGTTAQIFGPLTGTLVFLGRNEFSEQTEPIETPFFFQIQRNDFFDVAVGLRYLFLERFILSANFLVPLNDDGLRTDFIPTGQLEYVFSVPR